MALEQPFDHEHRRSFRCPATVDRDAFLVVRGKEVAVQILDESREGFGLFAADSPGVKDGEVVELYTVAGGFRVEVVKVRRFGSQYRLGLRRLAELPRAAPKSSTWSAVFHDQPSASEGPGRTRLVSFSWGLWMAVGSAAAFLAFKWTMTGYHQKPEAIAPATREQAPSVSAPADTPVKIGEATPYSLLSAGEYLHLSETQRLKIQQIIKKATSAAPEIRRVAVTGSTAGLPPQAALRLNGAMVEIMNVLDENQRQRWRNLTSAN